MKASRFVKAFEREVDHWERQLSQVLEVIEMILTVQRQWIYLEVLYRKHTYLLNFSIRSIILHGYSLLYGWHIIVCEHSSFDDVHISYLLWSFVKRVYFSRHVD